MRTQLLATFTTKEHLDDTVDSIKEAYTIVFSKIYILQNENDTDETPKWLICARRSTGRYVHVECFELTAEFSNYNY